MAAAGVPLRTIQHWIAHADAKTTQVYAHYQPSAAEAEIVEAAFALSANLAPGWRDVRDDRSGLRGSPMSR